MNLALAKRLFKITYGNDRLKASSVPQLNFLLKDDHDRNTLKDKSLSVGGGYFYVDESLSTDLKIDISNELESEIEIYPGVTNVDIDKNDYCCIPSFISSIYNVNDNYWKDLERNHKPRTVANYRKSLVNLHDDYNTCLVPLQYVFDNGVSALEIFNILHSDNILKYGHSSNPWNRNVLDALLKDTDLEYRVYVVTSKVDNSAIRAILVEVDKFNRSSKLLSQGQLTNFNHKKGINIYRDSTIDLSLILVDEIKLNTIWYGRGMPYEKYRMGANEFETINTISFTKNRAVYNILKKAEASNRDLIKSQFSHIIDSTVPRRVYVK